MKKDFDFSIIGAGPMGLSLGYMLSKKGYKIRIFETSSKAGGHARPFRFDGTLIEIFYHFFYKNDHESAMKWVNALSKNNKICWKTINTELININPLRKLNLDKFVDILKIYKILSFKIFYNLLKIFFLKIPFILKEENAISWSYKKFGYKFTNDVWKPLLKGKFGKEWKNISAWWLATRIKRHLSTKNVLKGKSIFGYLQSTYLDTIQKNLSFLKKKKSKIIYNSKIKKLIIKNNRITNIIAKKKIKIGKNEKVISTIPLFVLKKILDFKKLNYLNKFDGIGVVICIIKSKRKLSDCYWTSVGNEKLPFNAIIQQNRLYPKSKSEIIYTSKYTDFDSKLYKMNDKDIFIEIIKNLEKFYESFSINDVIKYKIFKSPNAAPIPTIHTVNNLPPMKSPLDNLWHGGLEYIYPEDRGVGNSIEISKKLSNLF